MEHIRETLPDGEELVLLDENEAETLHEGPDPRRVALRLRRDALAQQKPSSSKPTGPKPTGH